MAFTPEAPEYPEDLQAYFDTDLDEVAVLIYSCDQGDFYRDKSKWVAILETDEKQPDLEDLLTIYVLPSFIPIYDEAEDAGEGIDINEVREYEATSSETE